MVGTKLKCLGRFSETIERVFEAVNLVLEDTLTLEQNSIQEIWGLLDGDLFGLDGRDPYYESPEDSARRQPNPNYLSLIPLFPNKYIIPLDIREQYAISMGVDPRIAKKLAQMTTSKYTFFTEILGKDPSSLRLPNNSHLGGYVIAAESGIGSTCEGGELGGGLRSDSPYLLNIYKKNGNSRRETKNLAATIGFWAQGDTLLVSQMQSCKNGKLPEEVPFGITCLRVAERVAQDFGFANIETYTARGHPIFREHPDDWDKLGSQFVTMWDGSAKKLNFEGSRVLRPTYQKRLFTSIK